MRECAYANQGVFLILNSLEQCEHLIVFGIAQICWWDRSSRTLLKLLPHVHTWGLSPWYPLICSEKACMYENPIPQISHLNFVVPVCFSVICLLRPHFVLKYFSQCSHWYRTFSCSMRSCSLRWYLESNFFPHSVQLCKSPLCLRRWRCQQNFRVKVIAHTSQTYQFSEADNVTSLQLVVVADLGVPLSVVSTGTTMLPSGCSDWEKVLTVATASSTGMLLSC